MRRYPPLHWSAVLGFSLGGIFDGILLHQILQWHHLLSSVGGDLRFQVLWDGYFHALMYLLAALALFGLWRVPCDRQPAGWSIVGAALVGFGLWHLLDAVLAHWVLVTHRIRVDTEQPLLWDLLWIAAFGAMPLAAGWLVLRRRADVGARGRARSPHG
jgi:uncharacterized membrane protein